MKAAIHLGPIYTENLKVYKNTSFEEIQNLFNVLEHSEEILYEKNNWRYISLMDEIDIVSWSIDPVDTKQKYASTQTPYCVWGRCHFIQKQF